MKSKKVNIKQSINFSNSTVCILLIATLISSLLLFKLYALTNNSTVLALTIFIASGSIITLLIFLCFKVKEYITDRSNPLHIFKNRTFENWLINSGICKTIDDTFIEIPHISISMNNNDYYLDIQELYMFGNKLLESSSAINSYAYQQNCDITIIECYRYKGAIRYHFIKIY